MAEPITLQFRYTQDEVVDAGRMYYARTLRLKMDYVVGTVTLLVGMWVWRSTGKITEALFLFVLSGLVFAIPALAHFVLPLVFYRQEPRFKDEYWLQFSDEGILFRTRQIDSRLEWSLYEKAWENAQLFVLQHGKRNFTTIPKRAFASREDEAAFREMVQRHLTLTPA
jgi:hypothetical protein